MVPLRYSEAKQAGASEQELLECVVTLLRAGEELLGNEPCREALHTQARQLKRVYDSLS